MLSRLLRQFLFFLTHLIVFVLVAVQNVFRDFWSKRNIFQGSKNSKNNVELILKHVPNMSKKPRHLVFLVDSKHSLKDFAEVVIWSLVAGIPHISFYDPSGKLKMLESKLFSEVEKCKKGIPGCIKWSNMPNLNGYTNGIQAHTINMHIFTMYDGRTKITECVRQIAVNETPCRRKSSEITAQELDEALKLFYPSIPDPELVMYSGSLCCTHGLLPWQIRLTEFVQISKDHCVNIDCYIGALYKYNKCDQRFGK